MKRQLFLLGASALTLVSCALTGCEGSGGGPLVSALPTTLSLNPAMLTFTAVGESAAQSVRATEAGYTGAMTESDTCSGIATIAASGGASGSAVTFAVVPISGGRCAISVTDSSGQKATTAISITVTGFTVN